MLKPPLLLLADTQEPANCQSETLQIAVRSPSHPESHFGAQENLLGTLAVQFPGPALIIVGIPVHTEPMDPLLVQEPVVDHSPLLQVDVKVPVYPILQIGVQEDCAGALTTQFPGPELGIDGGVLQEVLVHMPVVNQIPEAQVADRVPVKATLQTGVHVVPFAALVVHPPAPAF